MSSNYLVSGTATLLTVTASFDLLSMVYARIVIESKQKIDRFKPPASVKLTKETPAIVIDGCSLCVLLSAEETEYLGSLDPAHDAALYLQATVRDALGQEVTSDIIEGRLCRRL